MSRGVEVRVSGIRPVAALWENVHHFAVRGKLSGSSGSCSSVVRDNSGGVNVLVTWYDGGCHVGCSDGRLVENSGISMFIVRPSVRTGRLRWWEGNVGYRGASRPLHSLVTSAPDSPYVSTVVSKNHVWGSLNRNHNHGRFSHGQNLGKDVRFPTRSNYQLPPPNKMNHWEHTQLTGPPSLRWSNHVTCTEWTQDWMTQPKTCPDTPKLWAKTTKAHSPRRNHL